MKNVIITGASRGIGKALVEFFLEKGHYVIAISRQLDALESKYGQHPKIKLISMDLTKKNAAVEIITHVGADVSIDILINNAGLLINKPFLDLNDEDIQRQIDVNFTAPVRLIKAISPSLNKKGAHVVNISSMGGVQGSSKFSGLSIYSAVKGALNILTEALATEFQETNTKYNALALGAVQTEMLAEAFPEYKAPLSSEEMAAYIGDFAINGSKYYNGKILQVALNNP